MLLALVACLGEDTAPTPGVPPVAIVPGPPVVGAAEGYLDLPVGTPLGGYTARCGCLGGFGSQDLRESAYSTSFAESTGVQTYPTIKVIWVENGDDNLVVTKTDSIYSFDGLVEALTLRLEELSGETLTGRVVHTANHSHSSWGTFNHGVSWYLGSDRYNDENFRRMVDRIATVAMEAYEVREPAKIGVGWAEDWDPTDSVYRDRRPENDTLAPWGADGPQGLGKDPHLGVIRFDTLADEPIAILTNFGMHGTLGSESLALASSDSGGHLEIGLEESFGDRRVVTMFTQGSAGDVSPAGDQDGYAAMESIGVKGAAPIRSLYDTIETSADPIRMETVTRSIRKDPSTIHVTRDGTVDWRYAPYTDDLSFQPDNVVYGESGEILSPIDEFNTVYGGIFCGSGDFDIPSAGLPVDVFPYDQCVNVDLITALVEVFFDLTPEQVVLPLPESLRAQTTASRIGPLPTRLASGETVSQDLFVGFFPGEPVYSFGEQWRRRVEAELGLPNAMMVGYSQDHEGYLLIPEDWLLGGYEPDIGIYGPLEGEHVLEGVLSYSEDLLLTTDVREDPDPLGVFGPTVYPEEAPSALRPDPTPDAGTRIGVPPAYLWTPFLGDGETGPSAEDLVIPAEVPRVQGMVQLAWEGGDPMVDSPKVVLERQEGEGWVPVTTAAGRVIDEGRHDLLLGHTPTPLAPVAGPQTHAWWAAWQAVGHWDDRASLALGTYRLHVTGRRWSGSGEAWPWEGIPYEVTSEPFEVVPGALTVLEDAAGLIVSLRAPGDGYRFVAQGGDEDGDNPVVGPVAVEIERPDGVQSLTVEPTPLDTRSVLPVTPDADWISIRVTDAFGNTGVLVRA